MKKLLILMSVLYGASAFAQDAVFYNTNSAQLYNNPAFAGLNKSFSFDAAYRNQWPNLSGNYVSSVTSVNQYLGKGNGVSIMFFTDNAANTIKKYELNLGYSKAFQLTDGHFLAIGVQAAYFNKSIDVDKLTFGSMIDPRRGFVYPVGDPITSTTASDVDFHSGLLYYNRFSYVSFSVKHLLEPNESLLSSGDAPLPRLFFGEVGGKITIDEVALIPYVRYRSQGSFDVFQGGLKTRFEDFCIELGLQNSSTFYGGFGYLGEHFKVGYNLVAYTSLGNKDVYFAHEVFLGCNLNLFEKENKNFFDF